MPTVLPALLALSLLHAPIPVLDPDDGSDPGLTMPGGPTIPLPPGSQLFGPEGLKPSLPPPAVSTPPAAPPAADAPQPTPSPAERRKARIDDLFNRLAGAKDEAEARAVGALLNHLWLQSGSDTADLLMGRAMAAMDAKDFPTAEAILDKLVVLQPGWAEAWNKRATVRYLRDDDTDSMLDIGRTLLLEPRHFGALSGMGFILHRDGQDRAALTVLRRAAAINPQDTGVKSLIDEIAPDIDGRNI